MSTPHRLLIEMRHGFTFAMILIANCTVAQPKTVSLGLYSGITAPYTWDEGINRDSRYKARYDVKLAPIGISYGADFQGFGFVFTPGISTIGQNFHVINSVGGHEGTRRIDMKYLSVPFALKLHVIDLSFFKISLLGSVGIGYLMDAKETITHNNAKFRFPSAVYPALPSDYIVEYDGVLAPKVKNYAMLTKKDYNALQWFGSAGFRSDWDITEAWRISLDVRGNYGVRETRTPEYIQKALDNQMIYDVVGKRREIFATLNVGIARFVEIDKEKEQKTKSFKKFTPKSKLPRSTKHRH
jgi:hypothetical protein